MSRPSVIGANAGTLSRLPEIQKRCMKTLLMFF